MITTRSNFLVGIVCSLAAVLLAGCGSGGGSSVTGTAVDRSAGTLALNLTFPGTGKAVKSNTRAAHTRAYAGNIPVGTQLVKLVVTDALTNAVLASKDVNGPTSTGQLPSLITVNFPALPVGQVKVTATAFPDAAAALQPIATGSVTATIQSLTTTNVTLNMALTLSSIKITPATVSLTDVTGPTHSATLKATVVNAANQSLVLPLYWTDGDPGIFSLTVSPTDPTQVTVTGIAGGTGTVTLYEPNSGTTTTATITVVPD